MAYGYEEVIKKELEFTDLDNMDNYGAMLKELEGVYRKAKAFDEVIKKVKTEFVSQDLADDIRTLVYDYEYDKEDE
ncbi:hypothetical protein [Staphylococcus phage vB_SurM-PSU4]|nr:hypothetical protein [Staphylococcus phage vB_SurM-PSU4]